MTRNGKKYYQELHIGKFILCVEDDPMLLYSIGMGVAKDVALQLLELSGTGASVRRSDSDVSRAHSVVREARIRLQNVFAKRFGVSAATVSLRETGRLAVPEKVRRFVEREGHVAKVADATA